MNFLIFAGGTGVMALTVTIVAACIGGTTAVISLLGRGRASFRLRLPLTVAGIAWAILLCLVTVYGLLSVVAAAERSTSDVDSSTTTVEDLVPLPGSDSTALAMREGGFNVAVERDGALVSVSVPDLQFIDAGDAPTLTTTAECALSYDRGFVWNMVYECTDTLVATVPR